MLVEPGAEKLPEEELIETPMELMEVTKVEPKVKPREEPRRYTTADTGESLPLLLLLNSPEDEVEMSHRGRVLSYLRTWWM